MYIIESYAKGNDDGGGTLPSSPSAVTGTITVVTPAGLMHENV